MVISIPKIALEDVYISVLTEKRVTNAEGWTRKEPVSHDLRPSGSVIVDAVVLLLHHNRFRDPKTAVERLAVNGRELSTALHLLTGFTLRSFIEHYRLMEAQEYLACTGLATKEIARRCGYTGRTEEKTFHKMFKLLTGMCVLSYRRQHRPRNFQDLYSWD
jgi:AraC-like DNA-binding protein